MRAKQVLILWHEAATRVRERMGEISTLTVHACPKEYCNLWTVQMSNARRDGIPPSVRARYTGVAQHKIKVMKMISLARLFVPTVNSISTDLV